MLKGAQGRTVLYGLGILLVIVAIAWLFLLSPRMNKAGEIQTQADQIVGQNSATENELVKLEQMANDAPAAAKRAQALFTRMPSQASIPQVLTQFTEAAIRAGINPEDISALTPGTPLPITTGRDGSNSAGLPGIDGGGANIAEIPITMTVTTEPEKFMAFLDNLAALDRIFIIDGIALQNRGISEETGVNQVGATMSGKMFMLQSELPDLVQQVDDLLKAAGQDVPNDSATPVPSGSATPVPSGSATPVPSGSATPVPSGGAGLDPSAVPSASPAAS